MDGTKILTKLEQFDVDPRLGNLVATINHIGNRSDGGHYVAYVRRGEGLLQDGLHQAIQSPFNSADTNTINVLIFKEI